MKYPSYITAVITANAHYLYSNTSKISKALIQLKSELKAVLDQCSCEEQRRRAVTLKMVQKELSSVLEVNSSVDPYYNSNTSRLVFSSNVANHR